MYARSPFVAQAFVYGDSLKPQLVAVVVPDGDVLLPWAAERGLPADLDALCRDSAVASAVLRSMNSEGQAAQLKGFEQVRRAYSPLPPFPTHTQAFALATYPAASSRTSLPRNLPSAPKAAPPAPREKRLFRPSKPRPIRRLQRVSGPPCS